jgi:hypothetical protein
VIFSFFIIWTFHCILLPHRLRLSH